ncbi:MAG: SoxR reducing system RseC family protein [Deltaproteobacteria bacterium]|nr:SoxR reducing system RseC family protein [Deltaproteobacteria bacterium]
MVREQGVVEWVKGGKALLRIERTSACATCESRGSCEMGPDKKMMVEVTNDLGAGTGDRVEVSVPTGSILKLSLLVYLFPILFLIAGAYTGGECAQRFAFDTTLGSIFGGGMMAAIAFIVLRHLDRRLQLRGRSIPQMTRILAHSKPSP